MATTKKTAAKKGTKAKKQAPSKNIRRGKTFNLDIKNPEQAVVLVAELENLKFSGGWKLLVQILEGNMAALERAIITRIDPSTGTKLSEAELDELRAKHAVFAELVEKPDDLIELFRKQSGGLVPAYDPYHTDIKAMLRGETAQKQGDSSGSLT